ncbi:MAG: hypothetical protein QXL51_00955 [Candidatus Aenigmatarchaeota archaeon]
MIDITNEQDRLFTAWATVEIRDKQGEIVPIEAIKKSLLALLDRGAPLMLKHSNLHVGKILNAEIRTHPETNKEGLYIYGKIFNHYKIDDEAWEKIKNGIFKGVSIGGISSTTNENGELDWVEPCEISLTENPANPLAMIEMVSMAKEEKLMEKPCGGWGYRSFEDCVNQNRDKSNPEAYCAVIYHKITGEWPSEKTEKEWMEMIEKSLSEKIQKNINITTDTTLDKIGETMEDVKKEEINKQDAPVEEVKPTEEVKPEEPKFEEIVLKRLNEITAKINALEERVAKIEVAEQQEEIKPELPAVEEKSTTKELSKEEKITSDDRPTSLTTFTQDKADISATDIAFGKNTISTLEIAKKGLF